MVEWWVLLRKTRMCSKEWLLNGLFLVFMSFWGFSFFWPGGRRGDLEHAGGAVNVIWRKPWRLHFSLIFLKGTLAPFALWCSVEMYPIHLLLWAMYHVFAGIRRLRLGSQIVWLGNTRTHMGPNIWRRWCGCSFVCVFFGMVWGKEGMNRKNGQRILEESVCLWEAKLLFFV